MIMELLTVLSSCNFASILYFLFAIYAMSIDFGLSKTTLFVGM